jgi:hypothetical protein
MEQSIFIAILVSAGPVTLILPKLAFTLVAEALSWKYGIIIVKC